MTTHVVTTGTWNDPLFWQAISESNNGHALDFSGLGAAFTVGVNQFTGIVSISDGATSFTVGEAGVTGTDANFGGATLLDYFTAIVGTQGQDIATGSTRDDVLDGNAGDDILSGGTDEDRIVGDLGSDTITGGAGYDILTGGEGADSIDGGDDADQIWGNAGDTIFGGEGGDDNDTLNVSHVDFISYTSAESGTITFNSGDTLSFSGIESIVELTPDGEVDGTAGNDEIGQFYFDADGEWIDNGDAIGESDADSVRAGDGNDTVWSGDGDDTVHGEAGNDQLNLGSGNNVAFGGTGADTINADWGNDTISGDDYTATGPNLIVNGSFEDTTGMSTASWGFSGAGGTAPGWTDANGNQIEFDNTGRNGLNATDGANWLDMEASAGQNMVVSQTVAGIGEGQVYQLSFDVADFVTGDDGTTLDNQLQVIWNGDVVSTIDAVDGGWRSYDFHLIGGSGDGTNTLTFSGAGRADYQGLSLDNVQVYATTEATGGADSIVGWDGDDDLIGGAGNDKIDAGAGNDEVVAGSGDDSITGDSGNDSVFAGGGDDTVDGGAGADLIYGDGATTADAVLVAQEDFTGGASGWTDNTSGSSPQLGDLLGPFAGTAGDSSGGPRTEKTFDLAEGYTAAIVEFDLLVFDSWDGNNGLSVSPDFDAFQLYVNGDQVANELFQFNDPAFDAERTGAVTIDGVEYTYSFVQTMSGPLAGSGTWDDEVWRVRLEAQNYTGDQITIGFGSTTEQAVNDESFGIDNLSIVSTNDTSVTIEDAPGNDLLTGGDGDDTIHGGSGDDTIDGGADNDLIYGDTANQGGTYFVTDTGGLYQYDTNSGTSTLLQSGLQAYGDIATGPDGTIYGVIFAEGTTSDAGIYSIDPDTGAETLVFDFVDGSETHAAMASDRAGNLYVNDGSTGNVTRYEPDGLGGLTNAGSVGTIQPFATDIVFLDHTTAWATANGSIYQYDVDGSGNFANETDLGTVNGQADIFGLSLAEDGTVYAFEGSGEVWSTDPAFQPLIWSAEPAIQSGGAILWGSADVLFTGGNDSIDAGDGNDTVEGGDGDDGVNGGAGADTLQGGTGADTIEGGAGDDSIDVGAADGVVDTVVMSDGDGDDTITGFEAPIANGDGSFTGQDQLDLSGMTDANGALVNTRDVTVDDDGFGNALLLFPNGESITLVGIAPADVTDEDALAAMGISAPDEIVEGTATADLIDSAYTDDPEGDMVDAGDAADGSDDDVIEAGGGNDTVFAGLGNDTIFGEAGNDSIVGNTGDDVLDGGAGNDTIAGGTGADTIRGGLGDDDIIGGIDISGGDGNDTIDVSGLNAVVAGDGGDDVIRLLNNPGTTSVTGGETDEVNGDTLDLSTATNPLTVDLTGADPESGTVTEGANVLTFSEIEKIVLGGGADTIVLADGSGDDVMSGFDMSDSGDGTTVDQLDVSGLTDAGGAIVNTGDVIVTDTNGNGTGDAILTFPGGETITLLGVAATQLATPAQLASIGIPQPDFIVEGTAGADTIDAGYVGDPEGDRVDAGDSAATNDADSISAGAGNDSVLAGAGNDSVNGGIGDDTVDGGDGNDTIFGFEGSDSVLGGAGDDVINTRTSPGTGIPDEGYGMLGDAGFYPSDPATINDTDYVEGGLGNDSILTGDDNDTIFGGDGADTIDAGFDDDQIAGGAGADSIEGNEGNDTIDGGDDADVIYGDVSPDNPDYPVFTPYDLPNDGTDLAPANNADSLVGGGGNDTIYGQDDNDTLIGDAGDDLLDGGLDDDYLDGADGNDTLIGGLGNDTLLAGNDAGADSLDGGAGNDSLSAGDGADTLVGGTGADSMFGSGGDDLFVIENDFGDDTIDGWSTTQTGGDTIDASAVTQDLTLDLSQGDAGSGESGTLGNGTGTASFIEIEAITLGTGNDVIIGSTGADSVATGSGDDTVNAGDGADTLDLGDGDDSVFVDQGDTMLGGAGDDYFALQDLDTTGTGNAAISITGGEGSETNGDTLQLTPDVAFSDITFSNTDDAAGGLSGSFSMADGTLVTFAEIENIICFTPGTRILTGQGERPIETLRIGDLVVTRDQGLRPIRWIGRRTVPGTGRFAPVRVGMNALDSARGGLLVSQQHRILFTGYRAELLFGENEVLVAAKHLVDGRDVVEEPCEAVTYIHMMFDHHEVIYAEGIATESFHSGDVGLSAVSGPAREELFAIFPELRSAPGHHLETARTCLKRHEAALLVDADGPDRAYA